MAGGSVAALVPQSLDEAFRVANAIAASGLAPKGVDKPEQVLVAIMAGAELGFAPFQAMQSFAVINGKPNIWGDAIPALLWSAGFDIEEWFDDADAPTKATCKITRPNGKEVERSFSVADAKRAGLHGKAGPWQQYQPRMLQMRARAFAARDGAADVLRGMQIAEEAQDFGPVRDVTDRPAPNLAARLNAPIEGAVTEGFTVHHPDSATEAPPVSETSAPATVADEAAPAGADEGFPGDAPSGEGAAESPEPKGDEEKGSAAFDHIAWADSFIADLPFLTKEQLDALETNKLELARFAHLQVLSVDKAREFEDALKEARAAFQ
ncbi:MAG: hypothetical protein EON90_09940 [Brevundimonas sp.]|nr:MAG: hypothetical protein EON90_09940 [Brevundimonas sp.]